MEALPLALLGIRTALKADIGCSAAELVYGTTLRLPGEFFLSSQREAQINPGDYASRLRSIMGKLRATPPRQPTTRAIHLSTDLASCTHVFVRHDAVRRSLQPPYDGPYKVLRRGDKMFTIDRRGRREVVSVDRLKPAHMDPFGTTAAPPAANTPLARPPAPSTEIPN